jgi:soluble lytic murein transglycosylase-like protein
MSTRTKFALILLLTCIVAAVASASEVAILRNGFTIKHERRTLVGNTTRLYLSATDETSFVDVPTTEIDRIEPDLTPAPEPPPAPLTSIQPASNAAPSVSTAPTSLNVADAVSAASDRYRLDPDLVNSVIRAESGFNPRAVSRKGAQGLMQLMPDTASKLGVPNAFDPEANVDGGTRYLRELLERYNFDIIKALAAYNAGTKRVEQYHGVPPYHETRAYVASIVRDFNRKKIAQQKAAKVVAQPKVPAQPAKAQAQSKPLVPTKSARTSNPTSTVAKRVAAPTGN